MQLFFPSLLWYFSWALQVPFCHGDFLRCTRSEAPLWNDLQWVHGTGRFIIFLKIKRKFLEFLLYCSSRRLLQREEEGSREISRVYSSSLHSCCILNGHASRPLCTSLSKATKVIKFAIPGTSSPGTRGVPLSVLRARNNSEEGGRIVSESDGRCAQGQAPCRLSRSHHQWGQEGWDLWRFKI